MSGEAKEAVGVKLSAIAGLLFPAMSLILGEGVHPRAEEKKGDAEDGGRAEGRWVTAAGDGREQEDKKYPEADYGDFAEGDVAFEKDEGGEHKAEGVDCEGGDEAIEAENISA